MNKIVFGGVDSSTFGIYAAGPGMYDKPRRRVTYIDIPGRNGGLAIDEDTFEDFDITFQCVMPTGFQTAYDEFCASINALGEYRVLSEQLHPDSFWLASFSEVIKPKPSRYYDGATFDLTFHCKPQRYLISGITQTAFTSAGTIRNPTEYKSRPNIRVYGYGTLGVGGSTVIISTNGFPYIDLDCEAMDARYGATNCNNWVTLTGDTFPTLAPGNNSVSMSGNITQLVITPRWWTI